ncbi:MAG TPA: TetR/AcrR family transcriptional regulator [Acidimicrobiales bacterium]|nr:TetR/AcrR family transcriptional regulator [Acidimicrobiales bacterium]
MTLTPTAPAKSAPRRRLTAARRRRQLIDVALETFATNGFNATTMEDIATAAGVTKPLLYQHFDSKRALYLELIDDVAARLIGALAVAAGSGPRTRRQVEEGFEAYFRFTIDNQSAVRMLFDSPHDAELARGLRTIEDSIAEFLAPLFDADIDEDHRRTLAAAVVGMTEGVTRDWLRARAAKGPTATESIEEAQQLAERLAGFAWGGLRSLNKAVG